MHYCKWSFHVARIRGLMSTILVLLISANPAMGAVMAFTSRPAWQAAAGSYTTIDFTGFAPGTIITNQYAGLGVTFTEGNDRINSSFSLFPLDGWGLNGVIDTFTLAFSQPVRTIAVDFPGSVQFKLYYLGNLIHTSNPFGAAGGGTGPFAGLVSDQPFDSVIVLDPQGGVFVDDLHFGQGIPTPAALALLAIAGLVGMRRRHS